MTPNTERNADTVFNTAVMMTARGERYARRHHEAVRAIVDAVRVCDDAERGDVSPVAAIQSLHNIGRRVASVFEARAVDIAERAAAARVAAHRAADIADDYRIDAYAATPAERVIIAEARARYHIQARAAMRAARRDDARAERTQDIADRVRASFQRERAQAHANGDTAEAAATFAERVAACLAIA